MRGDRYGSRLLRFRGVTCQKRCQETEYSPFAHLSSIRRILQKKWKLYQTGFQEDTQA